MVGRGRLGAVTHAKLRQDVVQVQLDRVLRDVEVGGDDLVRRAARHRRQHLVLASGQAAQVPGRRPIVVVDRRIGVRTLGVERVADTTGFAVRTGMARCRV